MTIRALRLCALVPWLACLAGAALGAPQAAHAQTPSPFRLDVQHLHPSAMPDSGIATEGGPGLPEWTVSVAASTHYGATLLRAEDPSGRMQATLLDHQAIVEPTIALGLPFGLSLQFSWPFVVSAADTEFARDITLATLRGQGIGDPRFQLAWRTTPMRDLRVLAALSTTIPTIGDGQGAWAELGSEANATVAGMLGLEGRIEIVTLRANAGVRGRTGDASIGSSFRVGSELTYAAGVEIRAATEVQILAELLGSTTFDAFGSKTTSPLELLAALRVHPVSDFEILPFGGIGLTEGYGTPAWRAGLALRLYLHTHDEDGDGVGDDQDRCPGQDEDRDGHEDDDGCPDLDDDGDGVPDASDRCPALAGLGRFEGCPDPDADHDGVGEGDRCPDAVEDADHFEDEDGCPELDNDGDAVPDLDDRCPTQA